jgi:hypothetical protein
MTNYNDGSWHGWNGGECPVHEDSRVDIVWLEDNGVVKIIHDARAGDKAFDGNGFGSLIAFRVIREHREPREFWISLNNGGIFNSPQENAIHVREVIEE